VTLVDDFLVVVTDGGGLVVVWVTLSCATPSLLRYVVAFEFVRVPSGLTLLSVRVSLNVPAGGAATEGVTVIVVCDAAGCAIAVPTTISSAAA
jgi:hypothetical protein